MNPADKEITRLEIRALTLIKEKLLVYLPQPNNQDTYELNEQSKQPKKPETQNSRTIILYENHPKLLTTKDTELARITVERNGHYKITAQSSKQQRLPQEQLEAIIAQTEIDLRKKLDYIYHTQEVIKETDQLVRNISLARADTTLTDNPNPYTP